MIYKLTDLEIREACVKAILDKTILTSVDPEECYFECEAGSIEGDSISDIHDVKFVFSENT